MLLNVLVCNFSLCYRLAITSIPLAGYWMTFLHHFCPSLCFQTVDKAFYDWKMSGSIRRMCRWSILTPIIINVGLSGFSWRHAWRDCRQNVGQCGWWVKKRRGESLSLTLKFCFQSLRSKCSNLLKMIPLFWMLWEENIHIYSPEK